MMANGKSACEVSFFDGVGVRATSAVVVVLCASSSSSFLKALSLESSSSAMGVLPISFRVNWNILFASLSNCLHS